MDTPENFYAILGVPIDADLDTIKRAYRQLARRFHPDLAGPEGAIEMKRINRAYAVLSDAEKRQHYDTVTGGVIDLRKKGFMRPRRREQILDSAEDLEFSGLNIFSTRGPLRAGPVIHSHMGVPSALSSVQTVDGWLIAAGSLDGKGMIWQIANGSAGPLKGGDPTGTSNPVGSPPSRGPARPGSDNPTAAGDPAKAKIAPGIAFVADPGMTIESLRELRFSEAGTLLGGWGRTGLHIWDACNGTLLWSYGLQQRAISAHYSLDMTLQVTPEGKRLARLALPLFREDGRAPGAWGVRGSDLVGYDLTGGQQASVANSEVQSCIEEGMENRRFWAIRMRALARDNRTLLTLSCAQVPGEEHQMAVVRRWNLTTRKWMGGKTRPQIFSSLLVGRCEESTPPYAVTTDATKIAFVHSGHKIRICDTEAGNYSELASGAMGGSAKLAISADGQWLAIAREDSEINEGVIDLWSISTGQVLQKFYHPWQISALHFAGTQLVVALTDGTIQLWQ